MSCWIVSQTLIDTLVQGALERGLHFNGELVTPERASAVGRALWRENHRSVNHRYERRQRTPAYEFTGEARLKPAVLYKQAQCFDYQSCENDDYDRTPAARFITDLKAAIEAELGLSKREIAGGWEDVPDGVWASIIPGLPAYEAAPWGI